MPDLFPPTIQQMLCPLHRALKVICSKTGNTLARPHSHEQHWYRDFLHALINPHMVIAKFWCQPYYSVNLTSKQRVNCIISSARIEIAEFFHQKHEAKFICFISNPVESPGWSHMFQTECNDTQGVTALLN